MNRCNHCGIQLTQDEAFYYEVSCEKCELKDNYGVAAEWVEIDTSPGDSHLQDEMKL